MASDIPYTINKFTLGGDDTFNFTVETNAATENESITTMDGSGTLNDIILEAGNGITVTEIVPPGWEVISPNPQFLLNSPYIFNFENRRIIICIFPGALVQTPSGFQKIEDLRAGDLILDEHGQEVKLLHNVKCTNSHKGYVRFPKNCWGPDLPNADLSITDGHPIRPPNSQKEVPVEQLANGKDIVRTEGSVPETYSLVTKDRIFVLINNIPVCTWSKERFEEYAEVEKLTYNLL